VYNVHEEWKTQICHFQIQSLATKEKSKSILQSSPNTAQKFTHSWSSRRQKDVQFGGRKDQTISNNFHEITSSNSDVSNDISSRQELESYPLRPPEALLSILDISRAVVIQMLCNFMGGKRR
jgi:hypothetical protein